MLPSIITHHTLNIYTYLMNWLFVCSFDLPVEVVVGWQTAERSNGRRSLRPPSFFLPPADDYKIKSAH